MSHELLKALADNIKHAIITKTEDEFAVDGDLYSYRGMDRQDLERIIDEAFRKHMPPIFAHYEIKF